jgi:hypothetical protein
MRIALNERGSLGFSKKLKMSFTISSWWRLATSRSPCLEPDARLKARITNRLTAYGIS